MECKPSLIYNKLKTCLYNSLDLKLNLILSVLTPEIRWFFKLMNGMNRNGMFIEILFYSKNSKILIPFFKRT